LIARALHCDARASGGTMNLHGEKTMKTKNMSAGMVFVALAARP
jgi:hypothetical protein